jgi:hypothetical protein
MAVKLQFSFSIEADPPLFPEPSTMRAINVLLASVVLSLAALTAGCASTRPEPPKIPEQIAYDKADYTAPTEFDMKFVPSEGLTAKRSAPTEGAYAPRLVSMEKSATPE